MFLVCKLESVDAEEGNKPDYASFKNRLHVVILLVHAH